jgi:hypothetical protein
MTAGSLATHGPLALPAPAPSSSSSSSAAEAHAPSSSSLSSVGGSADAALTVEELLTRRRPVTLPSRCLPGPSGQKRFFHPGCPAFDIDTTGKSAAGVLNEFGVKVLKCQIEYVVTTQEDPVNPFLTTIVCEGIVVARAGYSNKKMSRQVASRKALSILAPLLEVPCTDGDEGVSVVDTGNGVFGGVRATVASLEEREAQTLRLQLSDDRILDNPIGKTPVMVLQEHCHKHVGKLPDYSDVIETPGKQPLYRVTATLFSGERESAVDYIKRKAKQKCALYLLRKLYPHVELWGDLVESTNSRQRESKYAETGRARKRVAAARFTGGLLMPPRDEGTAPSPDALTVAEDAPRSEGGGGGEPSGSNNGSPAAPLIIVDKIARKMFEVTKEQLWDRIATLNNRAAGRQVVSLSTEPLQRKRPRESHGLRAGVRAEAGGGYSDDHEDDDDDGREEGEIDEMCPGP